MNVVFKNAAKSIGMKRNMNLYLIMDYIGLGVKAIIFFYVLIKTVSNSGHVRNIFLYLLVPFSVYFLFVVARIFRPYVYSILILELLCNTYFIVRYGYNHFLFLAFTLISIFSVFKTNKMGDKNAHKRVGVL